MTSRTEHTLLVVDTDGRELHRVGDVDAVRPIASVGKLLLLAHVAAELDAERLDGAELLAKESVLRVEDSGLWQHLDAAALSVLDCCRLVAAVSDNLATNVLLERAGLDRVREFATGLDVTPYELLDFIRDERGPDTAPTFALGSAASLVRFMGLVHHGVVSARVRDWMKLNVDLSLSAGALALDPLAHIDDEPGLLNKTGSDDGVRVDVGSITSNGRTVHYCAMAHWQPEEPFTRQIAGEMRSLAQQTLLA